MKIHWSVYFIVGLFVIIVSSRIENFLLFTLSGMVFFCIGIIKYILRKTKKEKNEPEIKHEESVLNSNSKDPKNYIVCKHCRAYNYPSALFCHYCGRRVK